MSNLLLFAELGKHKIFVSEYGTAVYLDELFQCVGCNSSMSNILSIRIYSSYNFTNAESIESHDVKSNLVNNDTSYFYFIKNRPVRFMLDSKKTKPIDAKNDKLRSSLYNYN